MATPLPWWVEPLMLAEKGWGPPWEIVGEDDGRLLWILRARALAEERNRAQRDKDIHG